MLNILVMGAGALGSFIGGHLFAAGHQVTLVGLSTLIPKIAADGLTLRWPNRPAQTIFPGTATTVVGPETAYDFVLLAVKSPDTATAVKQLATLPLAGRKTYFVSFQNGIGNEEQLAAEFGRQQVIAGTVTIPISVPELGVIEVSKAKGGLGLAPLAAEQPVNLLAGALNQAGLPTATYPDYRAMKWSKLLLNIVNNASSAILNQPPAEIIAHPQLFNLEIEALREGAAVMKAQGLKAVNLPGYPVDWLVRLVSARWLPLAAKRTILRPFMVSGRGTKMPSLQIDLAAGQPTSEVGVLNGAIARAGQNAGIPTPANQTLTELLNGLVSGQLAWTDYQRRPDKLLQTVRQTQSPDSKGLRDL
ncbi:MAG: ketopantoate reductase family protein [Anaerolineae bacterium]|nr:ketopantoate reductase family protein [Anaerolineae bacterium]